MNQRERFLAIAVGGLVVLGGGQWGFSKYKNAIEQRRSRYESLQERVIQLSEKRNLGALADRQMGEFLVRSLSSNVEQARSDYRSWLFDVIEEHEIQDAMVSGGERVTPVRDAQQDPLYHQITFEVTGRSGMPEILGLLHGIQKKDYLHRIRDMEIKPAKGDEGFAINLSIEVISLVNAPVDATPPETDSWRVDPELVAYTEPILNRNLYEPPNKAPSYNGQRTLQATRGRQEAFPLTFADAESHRLTFSLVDAPENVTIDERSGTLRVESDELTEFDVVVEVTDNGYPKQSVKETLLVKVVDPPPPPKEEPKVEMKFDDAKQTYLTGLVQGANDWTAWMNVRTRGKTLKLRVGDEFEIGSVRGVVKSIDAESVKIQIADRVISMSSGGTLKSAVDATEE